MGNGDYNSDYPFKNFIGTGTWKYKAPKVDKTETKDSKDTKEEPEKPVPCVKTDGFKPWPPCP